VSGPAGHALARAFREDHALLGRGFHQLGMCLRRADLDAAIRVAQRLDHDAGGHIAFEEEDFYPALAHLIGDDEVAQMRSEHHLGLDVVTAFLQRRPGETLAGQERDRFVAEVEAMSRHIDHCGELFEALGRLPDEAQADLLARLEHWRRVHPRWSDHGGPISAQRDEGERDGGP
jgi:hypothetical protein